MFITRYVYLLMVIVLCCSLAELKETTRIWGRLCDTDDVANASFSDKTHVILGPYRVYQCTEGFVMNIPEDVQFKCANNYTSGLHEWRAKQFPDLKLKQITCKNLSKCDNPPPPSKHMHVVEERYKLRVKNPSTQLPRVGYFINDTVRYECDTGYHRKLQEDIVSYDYYEDPIKNSSIEVDPLRSISTELACGADGLWSGLQEEEDIDVGTCEVTECDATLFFNISNGNVTNYRDTYRYGETMKLSCDRGFRPIDENDAVTCSHPTSFELPEQFGCEQTFCPEPADPINGFVRLLGRGVDENATFNCNYGYTMIGHPHWTCQESGHWDQSCVICVSPDMFCTPPCLPPGAYMKSTTASFSVGSTVELSCKGNVFGGSEKRTCLPHQMWSGSQLDCIGDANQDVNVGVHIMEAMERIDRLRNTSLENETDTRNDTEIPSVKSIDVGNPGGVDLYFLVDVSKSTEGKKFKMMNKFIETLLPKLGVGQKASETRLALYYFASNVKEEFNDHFQMDEDDIFENYKEAQTHISQIKPNITTKTTGSGTAINAALKDIIVQEETRQHRLKYNEIDRMPQVVLIVLSDGKYTTAGSPEINANILKDPYDVEIYSIAVGDDHVGWNTMAKIASTNKPGQHFFKINPKQIDLESVIKNMINPEWQIDLACGYTDPSKTNLKNETIAATKFATKHAWPWMAQLEHNNQHLCGGSLINKRWILTAAHCFNDIIKPNKVNLRQHNIVDADLDVLVYHIDEDAVIKHENYNSNTWEYDIALIPLKEEVSFTNKVNNVCLWNASIGDGYETLFKKDKVGFVTGWSKSRGSDTSFSEILKQMQMLIMHSKLQQE